MATVDFTHRLMNKRIAGFQLERSLSAFYDPEDFAVPHCLRTNAKMPLFKDLEKELTQLAEFLESIKKDKQINNLLLTACMIEVCNREGV